MVRIVMVTLVDNKKQHLLFVIDNTTMTTILDLPAEIIQHIGKNVDYSEAQILRLVCSSLCFSISPIALSKSVLTLLEEPKDIKTTLEKWIAYASKKATATANGYVQTLCIRYIGKITAFEDPTPGESILRDDRDPQWYLAEPDLRRVGTLLIEILKAIPALRSLEWRSAEGHPMNIFLFRYFQTLELVHFSLQFDSPGIGSEIPDVDLELGAHNAFKNLRSIHIGSWYNSDYKQLQPWLAETIRQSPALSSLDIRYLERCSTECSPSFEELFPLLEEEEIDSTDEASSFAPLKIEHLSLYGIRTAFNKPHVIHQLRHLRSLKFGNILYGPPTGVLPGDLWKPLEKAGIYPERIEFNLSETDDNFIEYLKTYPPDRIKSIILDNSELLWQAQEDMDTVATRFYREALATANVRDSLEELVITTRDPDNWLWGAVPGMIEAVEACKKLTFERLAIKHFNLDGPWPNFGT